MPLVVERDWERGQLSKIRIIDGKKIQFCSLKLTTFLRSGTKCVCCGLEGRHFKIEKTKQNQKYYYLELYCNDGTTLTSDHIIPKGIGGSRASRNNRQTLCSKCNNLKGSKNISNKELIKLRREYE